MRRASLVSLALVGLLATFGSARADFINGGFETGNFTGWSTIGDTLVVTGAIGVTPPQGVFQAFLTTASESGDDNNFSGNNAVSASNLETFLGLASGSSGGIEGSALSQVISAMAGDVLTFKYNFLTTEGANDDFAFFTIKDTGAPGFATLTVLAVATAATTPSAVELDPTFVDPTFETGYSGFSYVLPTSGTFLVGLGVVDVGDEFIPSGLLVDDVRVGPQAPGTVVPEPASLIMFGVGCVGLALRSMCQRGRGIA